MKTSGAPVQEDGWELFWQEFIRSRHVREPARWLWFELRGPDTDGLLRITDGETLVFGRRRDGQWYFVGAEDDSFRPKASEG